MASQLAQTLSHYRATMPEAGSGLKQGIQNYYGVKQLKSNQALQKKQGALADIQIEEKKLDMFDKQYGPAIMASVKSPELWTKNQQAQFLPEGMSFEEGEAYTMFKLKKEAMSKQAEVEKEFLKEERKNASEVIGVFNKDAKETIEMVDKMGSLKEQAKGRGTSARAARISMIANIVRLNSPGIVQEGELQTYAGGQKPIQAVFDYLKGKGVETASLEAYYDPAGDNFDAEGAFKLGKTLAASKAGSLVNLYGDAKTRATRAGMSERAFNTNFGSSELYKKIIELHGQTQPSSPQAAQPATALPPVNNQGWKLMIDAQGNRAYVGPNGEIEEFQ